MSSPVMVAVHLPKRVAGTMKRKSHPTLVGSIVEEILSQRGYLSVCREYEVVQQWPRLVGDVVAANTVCEKAENGRLYVRVTSAPWRQEMTYLKNDILEKIRRETSCHTIIDIVFH